MRGLKEKGLLTELQSRFFESKETEELYDLVNDPFETTNLIGQPNYSTVAKQMRAHYKDWNEKNHDFGLDPIDWKNATPPKASAIIKWLEKARPQVIEKMKQGVEQLL
jgi:hypothetical protein